jgi:hypothetical protein
VANPPAGYPAALEIVIPARNEAGRLPSGLAALCAKAAALPLRTAILVVDSASTDGTGVLVRGWDGPVPVGLLQCQRAGKGLAVRAGLLATQAPFVGFCDADMATDLSALDVVVTLLAAGRQVVIGSRGLESSEVEDRHRATRRVGAALFRALARRVVPDVTDTQCGFKFFDGPLARAAARGLRTPGFAFDVELLANCKQLGASVTEIPVRWRDMPGSTFSVQRHSAEAFHDVTAIWLRQVSRRLRVPSGSLPYPAPAAHPVPLPRLAAARPAAARPVAEASRIIPAGAMTE